MSQIDELVRDNAKLWRAIETLSAEVHGRMRQESEVRVLGAAILQEVADAYGFSVLALQSAGRQADLVRARHEAFFRMVSETLLSTPNIGRIVGHRDHTTVLHGIRRHCERNNLPLPRGMTWPAKGEDA